MDQIRTILMQSLHCWVFYGGYSGIILPTSESRVGVNSYCDHDYHNLSNHIYVRTS